MAFCIRCGHEFPEMANFCAKCGTEVPSKIVDDVDDDEFEEADDVEVEDCDETPEKGPPDDLYATFSGREVILYRGNGVMYRRISLPSQVECAQVSGDRVAITCANGNMYIYSVYGQLVRQCRA